MKTKERCIMNKLDPRNIYDDLHQIPELGFEEFKTSAYLALSLIHI